MGDPVGLSISLIPDGRTTPRALGGSGGHPDSVRDFELREKERHTDRQTYTQIDIQSERERERKTDTQTVIQAGRQTDRDRQRQRHELSTLLDAVYALIVVECRHSQPPSAPNYM